MGINDTQNSLENSLQKTGNSIEFPQSEQFNQSAGNKISENSRYENFWKFRYTSRGCSSVRKFQKMLFYWSMEISGKSNQDFHRMQSALGFSLVHVFKLLSSLPFSCIC